MGGGRLVTHPIEYCRRCIKDGFDPILAALLFGLTAKI
jgi:hypothetical protein